MIRVLSKCNSLKIDNGTLQYWNSIGCNKSDIYIFTIIYQVFYSFLENVEAVLSTNKILNTRPLKCLWFKLAGGRYPKHFWVGVFR